LLHKAALQSMNYALKVNTGFGGVNGAIVLAMDNVVISAPAQ